MTGQPHWSSGSGADHAVLAVDDVSVRIDGRTIVRSADWTVERDQHWIVIGPNGGGKSTLVAVAGLHRHPTSGVVRLLGQELGRVDIRPLRGRVGTTSAVLGDQLRSTLTAEEVVRCGRFGALEPWWHHYDEADTSRAERLLTRLGLDGMSDRSFGTLSSGERQRCLLARCLMPDPDLLLLDEPNAGLDLGAREALIDALDDLASDPSGPATVLVTHHVEDIPTSATHLLALAGGAIVTQGRIDDTLTAALLEKLFAVPVSLERRGGRWRATGQSAPSTPPAAAAASSRSDTTLRSG